MELINGYMLNDHRECDEIFVRASEAAAASDWTALERHAGDFLGRIGRHIEMEETLLFPAFEENTGMGEGGPTATMRGEHAQMRPMFAQMREAITQRNAPQYRQVSQALHELLQQHNMKEEQMMYPMLDQSLGDDASRMLEELVKRAQITA